MSENNKKPKCVRNKKGEIWKDIPGYEGLYMVSNLGRVCSLDRQITHKNGRTFNIKGILRKPVISNAGYLQCSLSKRGEKIKMISVHKLVAIAFLSHIPDGTNKVVVDHINHNKLDNKLENLQLISNRENSSKDKIGYSSKYVGVRKFRNKWRAHITTGNKRLHLGTFKTEYEAHLAYQQKLKQL